jgi:hypothetical protein
VRHATPSDGFGQGVLRAFASLLLDRDSAQFVDSPGRKGSLDDCAGDSLTASADVRFESTDGLFVDERRTAVVYRYGIGLAAVGFTSEHERLSRDLMIGSSGYRFAYSTAGPDALCAGEVELTVQGSGWSDYYGDFVWSKSGCAVGLSPVSLDASSAPDMDVVRAIERVFGHTSYLVQWDDKARPGLTIAVKPSLETSACEKRSRPGRNLLVPVKLSYGSDDGRIVTHGSDARVDVQVSEDGALGEPSARAGRDDHVCRRRRRDALRRRNLRGLLEHLCATFAARSA